MKMSRNENTIFSKNYGGGGGGGVRKSADADPDASTVTHNLRFLTSSPSSESSSAKTKTFPKFREDCEASAKELNEKLRRQRSRIENPSYNSSILDFLDDFEIDSLSPQAAEQTTVVASKQCRRVLNNKKRSSAKKSRRLPIQEDLISTTSYFSETFNPLRTDLASNKSVFKRNRGASKKVNVDFAKRHDFDLKGGKILLKMWTETQGQESSSDPPVGLTGDPVAIKEDKKEGEISHVQKNTKHQYYRPHKQHHRRISASSKVSNPSPISAKSVQLRRTSSVSREDVIYEENEEEDIEKTDRKVPYQHNNNNTSTANKITTSPLAKPSRPFNLGPKNVRGHRIRSILGKPFIFLLTA